MCDSLSTSFTSLISTFLMAPKREMAASRAQDKHPTEPSQPDQTEARRKARYDTALFNSVEEYQRYKQKFTQRKVIPGRSINFYQLQYFGFEGLFGRMGWLLVVMIFESIFPTLVRAFYSRVMISCPAGVCPVDWCSINWCTLISVLRRE